jgi:membrane protease YdiL (CAAX protease family)
MKEHRDNTKFGVLLETNKLARFAEIILVFISAFTLIKLLEPLAGDNLVLKQAIIWLANILMLILVWLGIKLRGNKLSDFGITFKPASLKESLNVFYLSLLVFITAVVAFILGSIIMANITGIPETANLSNYEYLQGNIFMLLLTLAGVYIVSSFGEEVIYRAFLINRLIELGLDGKTGRFLAVFFSAVIFGLVHYEWGPMGIVQTGFMGLALGLFYLKLKKRIWILILAHAYMDTILMVQMYLANSEQP